MVVTKFSVHKNDLSQLSHEAHLAARDYPHDRLRILGLVWGGVKENKTMSGSGLSLEVATMRANVINPAHDGAEASVNRGRLKALVILQRG